MNENDVMKFKNIMQELYDLIAYKDVEIHNAQSRTKEEYEKGFARGMEEGMAKCWEVARAIVGLKWNGAFVSPQTVEDWFNNYTAQEAVKMLEHCLERAKEKPYWKNDVVHQYFMCSNCGYTSKWKFSYCPECGKEMEG